MKNKTKKSLPKGTVRQVFKYVGHYRLALLFSLLLAAASVAMTLYVPILIGEAIDLIVDKGQVFFDDILVILKKIVVLVLATALAQWLMNMVNNRITYHIIRDVRNDACRKIQHLPLSYLDAHPTGDIVSRVIADVDQFADGLLLGFTQFFTGVLTIVGTLLFMLYIHPGIALLVVILTPLSLFVARFIASRTHNLFAEQAEERGKQTALIDEMVTGARVVRAFSMEDEVSARFDEINDRHADISVRAIFFSSLVNPSTRFVNNVIYAVTCLFGALTAIGFAILGGGITVGALSGLLSYTTQYTKPFNEISGVVAELQNSLACAARVFEFLELPPESADTDAEVLHSAEGEIVADSVYFSYTPERRLIENFCLRVSPGERVAIVGPTGCGKTTLINLLMRFYDTDRGDISVDGKRIKALTRHSLRRNYGMVLQETWLFAGTVRDNIAMGKPDASQEEIVAAAKAAHAHSFIMRLPEGYDTVITENGASLSAGQRQLLCIARVMLVSPPMLILDEATSSIDTRTEIRIQKAFDVMMKGKTSFVVAHRLSTVREADKILVMKDGNVVEQGTHDSLLAAGGFYATLYNSQFEQA